MSTAQYMLFWILPLISAFMWLGMLLAMFIVWEVEGSYEPSLPSQVQDGTKARKGQPMRLWSKVNGLHVGAQKLKPLFITGCCVTTVFLDLSFAAERWLRHTGRLARNTGVSEKTLSAFSIVFAIAGTVGLISLSILDTLRYPHLHDGFLLLFLAGYIISAIFICAEYQRLGIHFRHRRVLRASFWLKLIFILVEVGLAVIFIATSWTSHRNIAAVFEWIIALIFTFYVLTFSMDLFPAARANQLSSNMEHTDVGHTAGNKAGCL